jgi:DNA replicative helicase MCM subunit Mcm2 (Cdc46/Mcm family)
LDQWDADDNNEDQNLPKYLYSLTHIQRDLVKGIFKEDIHNLLRLSEEEFSKVLRYSLTLKEIALLDPRRFEERQKLMAKITAVWKLHKEIIGLQEKDHKRAEEAQDDDINRCWKPKHQELEWLEEAERRERLGQVLSVSQASRLNAGKKISVKGIISGVQPLRKMIKGISCKCIGCNQTWATPYSKPELFESFVPVETIRKCPTCKTGAYLGPFNQDVINAVIIELKDQDTFSEIDPLRIIIFGDENPEYDDTKNIERAYR